MLKADSDRRAAWIKANLGDGWTEDEPGIYVFQERTSPAGHELNDSRLVATSGGQALNASPTHP